MNSPWLVVKKPILNNPPVKGDDSVDGKENWRSTVDVVHIPSFTGVSPTSQVGFLVGFLKHQQYHSRGFKGYAYSKPPILKHQPSIWWILSTYSAMAIDYQQSTIPQNT